MSESPRSPFSWARAAGGLGLVAWLFVLLRGAWLAPGAPMEEGKLLVAGRLVSQGRWPHEAFEHIYGPGDVWAVGGLFRIFGEHIELERAVGVVATLVIVGSVVVIGERVRSGAGLIGGALTAAVQVPFGVHAYSWTLGLAALTAGVAALGPGRGTDDRHRRLFASGLLCGGALVFRPDLVLASAVVGVIVHRTASGTGGRPGRTWLSGAALGVSPWLAHVGLVGVGDVVSGVIIDPLFRLRGGRSLPLPYRFDAPAATLDRVVLSGHRPDAGIQLTAGFAVAVLVPLLAAAMVVWARRSDRPPRRSTPQDMPLSAAVAVAVAVLPQLLQRPDAAHLRFVAPLALGLAPAVLTSFLRSGGTGVRIVAAVGGASVALLVAAAHAIFIAPASETAAGDRSGVAVRHDGSSFLVPDEHTAGQVRSLLSAVDSVSADGGRLIVWNETLGRATYSEAYLYFLLPAWSPGSRFLEANPGLATGSGSTLPADVARADIVILSSRFAGWDEPNGSRDSFAPGLLAQQRLCTITTTEPYTILGRCRREP